MRGAIGCLVVVGAGVRRLGLVALMLACSPTGASAAGPPVRWSTPRSIDTVAPLSVTHAIGAVACPSASLCVAVDDVGNVLRSSAPTSGASAWTLTRGADPSGTL